MDSEGGQDAVVKLVVKVAFERALIFIETFPENSSYFFVHVLREHRLLSLSLVVRQFHYQVAELAGCQFVVQFKLREP